MVDDGNGGFDLNLISRQEDTQVYIQQEKYIKQKDLSGEGFTRLLLQH